MDNKDRERAAGRRIAWAAAAAVFAGCVLRLTGLEVHSLWYDEGATLYLAKAPSMVDALRGSRHPPVAIALLRVWILLFGEGDAALRMLPALLSCASLAVFYKLARAWCTGAAPWIAVAMYAISPFHIWYGQEVTPYAFMEFGALVALAGTADAVTEGAATWRRCAVVFLGTAFAFGSQYLGALAGVSCAVFAAAAAAQRKIQIHGALRIVGAAALGGLVWAPWLATVFWNYQRHTVWGDEARTSLRELAELPARLLVVEASAVPEAWRWTGVVMGVLVWAGIAWSALLVVRRRRAALAPALAAFAASLAIALALALVAKNFLPRYMTAVSPFVAVLAAEGLASIPIRAAGLAASCAVLAVLGAVTWIHRLGNRREDYRSACALVEQRWKPGDQVIVVTGTPEPFARGPVVHYLRHRSDILQTFKMESQWPREGAPHSGRMHIIDRVNAYSEPDLKRAESGRKETFRAGAPNKIQYIEVE